MTWRTNRYHVIAVGKILCQSALSQLVTEVYYHITKNFQGRKLSRIGAKYDFRRENFRRLLAWAANRTPCPQSSLRKLSRRATKSRNLKKISLSKVFPVYNILCLHMHIINYNYLVFIHFLLTIISSEKLPEWATVVSATEVEELPWHVVRHVRLTRSHPSKEGLHWRRMGKRRRWRLYNTSV